MELIPIIEEKIKALWLAYLEIYSDPKDDEKTIKSLRLRLLGYVLKRFGMSWTYINTLFKTKTPIHPDITQILTKQADEETISTLNQSFVKNEKLIRIIKNMAQHSVKVDPILAVDGLSGTNGPNFEYKNYINNLMFGKKDSPLTIFDEETDFKRLHVQTVRELYDMIGDVPEPAKQIYLILRLCFMEMIQTTLPEIEINESIGNSLQGKYGSHYMRTMGRDHIQNIVKSLRWRGEKRTSNDRE